MIAVTLGTQILILEQQGFFQLECSLIIGAPAPNSWWAI